VKHDLPITQFGLSAVDMDSTALEVLQGDKRATTGLHASSPTRKNRSAKTLLYR